MTQSWFERPVIVIALSVALAIATAAAGAATILALAEPPASGRAIARSAAPKPELVQRFYDAANVTIRTGDTDALKTIIGADFIDWAAPSSGANDRQALIERVVAIGTIAPGSKLHVIDISVIGDHVAARVELHSTTLRDSGLPAPQGMLWDTYDLFRLDGNVIVGHWGDTPATASIRPLVPNPVELSGGIRAHVVLERRELQGLATDVVTAESAPAIVVAESGDLRVQLLDRTEDTQPEAGTRDGTSHLAPRGTAAIFFEGDRVQLSNDSSSPVTALIVTFQQPAVGGAAVGTGVTNSSVSTTVLAGGLASDLPSGRYAMALSLVTLAPGSAIPRHPASGLELLTVLDGALFVATNDVAAWILDAERGTSQQVPDALLAMGDGALLPAGSSVAYSNVGTVDATAIIVTLAPIL